MVFQTQIRMRFQSVSSPSIAGAHAHWFLQCRVFS